MSTPGTLPEALSEIDRLQKVVKVLRESLGEPDDLPPVSLAERLVDHEESARVLRELIEGTDPSKGEEFFSSLVRHLSAALKMKYAVAWTFLDGARDRMQSLAVWAGDKPGENFTALIPETPCEQTVQRRTYCGFTGGVRQLFPRVEILAALKIESYFAAPLFGTDGQVVGNLVVMDDRPGQLSASQRTLLELFAARAGAELGRRTAELALKRSEAHFRALIEQASDVVTVLAVDGTVQYQSPSLERVMGWRPEERQGRSAFEQMHPEDVPRAQATMRDALARPGEVRSGEFRLRHRDGAYRTLEIVGRAVADVTGAPCIILNMRDVTERRQAERERSHALQDLRNIMETVPDFLFTLDTNGSFVRWNPRVLQATGYDREELLNRPALDFVPVEEREQTAAAIRRAFAEGYAELEGHLLTKDGRLIPYHWTGAALKDHRGELIGITGVGRDVSERKRSEAEIRRHRQHLLDAQALAHLGSWEWDIDAGTVKWSEEHFRIFGHEPGALAVTDDTFLAALHPDDHDRVLKSVNDALLGSAPYDVICRIIRPSGDIRNVHCRGEVDRDEAGRPVRMAGTVLDVTERVCIEEALRAGEERWQLAVRGSNDGIWDWNIKTGRIFFSSRWKAIRGYADEELGNDVDEWRSRIHPDDLDRVMQRLDAYLTGQLPEYCEEYRVLHKDGSYRWVLDRGLAIWDEKGTPLRMAGSESDVTERKQTETALRMSEERLRLAMDIAELATWDWNIRTNEVIWSDNCEAVKRLPPGTFKGTLDAYQQLVHPEDLSRLRSDIERALAGRDAYHSEHRLVTSDGVIQWIEGNGYVYRDGSDQPIRVIGTARNITERKNTEEALRDSEQRLRQTLHASNTGLWEWNTETGEVRLSKEWKSQLGYGETELANAFETWESRLHPDDRDRAVAYAQAYRLNPVGAFRQDFRLRHKDGSYRWIDSQASFVTEPDGRRVRLLGSHSDITERKKGEEQLQLTQFTMDRLSEAIFWVGPDARMMYVNDAASRMLGYTREELLSMSVPEIDPNFPADAWPLHWEEVKRRGSFTFESIHRRKDGTVFHTEVTVNYLHFDGKEVNCGIMRDITERKRAESALKEMNLALAQAMPGISRIDAEGHYLEVNDSYAAMLGYEAGDLIGQSWEPTVHPEDRHLAHAAYDRMIREGKGEFESRAVRKDGSRFYKHVMMVKGIGPSIETVGYHCFMRDVTERKQAEESLRSSEEKLRQALLASNTGIWDWNTETGEVHFSPEWKRQLGFDDTELADAFETWEERLHPDDRDRAVAYAQAYRLNPVGPFRMDFRLRHKDGSYRWLDSHASFVTEPDGRRVRLLGSHTDITERKRAEEALRLSEERFRLATEATNCGVLDHDLVEQKLFLSPGFTRMLGVSDGTQMTVEQLLAFNHPEDAKRIREAICAALDPAGDGRYGIDKRIIRPSGEIRWLTVKAQAFFEGEGPARRAVRVLGVVLDTTERKRTEEALTRSHALLKSFVEHTPMAVAMLDRDLRYVAVSRRWLEDYRLGEQDLVGKRHYDVFPEIRDMQAWQDVHQRCLAGAVERCKEDHFTRADGTDDWIRWEVRPWQDVTGHIGGIIMFTEVITARKAAEEALRRSEERYARATAVGKVGVWDLDVVRGEYHGDDNLKALFGYGPEELSTDPYVWLSLVHPEDQSAAWHAWERILAGETDDYAYHIRIRRKDGTVIWTAVRGHALRDEKGRVIRLIGATVDVTERYVAELELQRTKDHLEAIIRSSPLPIVTFDPEGLVTSWNPSAERMFGWTESEVVGHEAPWIPPGEEEACEAYWQQIVREGGAGGNEVTRCRKDGSRFEVKIWSAPVRDNQGRIAQWVGFMDDVTELKQAHLDLQRREGELRTVLDALPIGVWFTDSTGKPVLNNPASQQIWSDVNEVEFEAGSAKRIWKEITQSVNEPHRWTLSRVLTKGEPSLNEIFELKCGGGIKKTILNSAVPVRDEDGTVLGAVVLNEDITERVRTEEALRQNHSLLSAIMDASIDLVYVKDLHGRYVHMNRAGATVLGMGMEDIIGWDDVALWGSELAVSCKAADRRVTETGDTVTVEECDTLHGEPVYYLTTKAPYRDPEGRIIGVIGVSRNITERKQAELERERRFAELHAIFGMTLALSRASSLEQIYQQALDGVQEALACDRASILLFDAQDVMRFQAWRGISDSYRRAVDGHSPWTRGTNNPQPILIADAATDPAIEAYRSIFLDEGIQALAFIPLMSPDGLLGKFMLYYNGPHRFTDHEVGVAQTIAGHVAYVIQRARAGEALRLSEERFAKAFRASLHPVVVGELETGTVIEANEAAYQLFGYTKEEVVGRTTLEIGLWPSAEARARFVELLRRKGSVRNLEASLRMKNGTLRHCLLSSELIELDGKQCMVTVGNDITDRKRAEEELRSSHAFLRQVIDIDPNFIFAKDRGGRFTLANKALADAYGTTVENLTGKTDAEFNLDREQVEFFRRKDIEVLDTLQERFIPEEVITDSNGKIRWLQTVKRPILDAQGQATMVLGASTDITERKRMEEALRQRERDLRAAIQEREQISQDLHDGILQSLYAMGLSLETCRPLLKKFRAKKITQTLTSVVNQLNAVMGEVRAFIAGLETELWRKQDVSSAIRTMVQTLAQPHATRYRVAIDPSVNEALSPEQGMHLFSIVKEAMSNCLRHAKATRASVSLRKGRQGFKLTVTDNGVGFVPAEVAQTGHGLANMASRATRLRGNFTIQSKPKQGTRIILTIPKETAHV